MTQRPSDIRIRKQSRLLQLDYEDDTCFELPFELLRVWSPSAEVRGHGAGQSTLQTGKKEVMVTGAEMVGNYALKLTFSDGHDSGIFTWDYLWDLGEHQNDYWQRYLTRLEQEGGARSSGSAEGSTGSPQSWSPAPSPGPDADNGQSRHRAGPDQHNS